jgi:hypothetical protein
VTIAGQADLKFRREEIWGPLKVSDGNTAPVPGWMRHTPFGRVEVV